ncbi:MAG TPA: class I SAM-dependent methyltransferase [Candidatus Cybelea sp.]|nr:class I SAM-dependent methyltransferase [Candidatus Cybelea sp.]
MYLDAIERQQLSRRVRGFQSELTYLKHRVAHGVTITRSALREHGLSGMAERLFQHLRWLRSKRQRDREFDRISGMNTRGLVGLWRLGIRSDNVRHGYRYQAIDAEILRRALQGLGRAFHDFVFIDLGCGKGRALLIASKFGFSRVIGVEFATKLAAIAEKNCRRAGISATVVPQDALGFPFPAGNLVVFLFNPFGPAVLTPVVDHLAEAAAGERYIIYVNPKHRACLDAHPRMECVRNEASYGIWKVRSSDSGAR